MSQFGGADAAVSGAQISGLVSRLAERATALDSATARLLVSVPLSSEGEAES
ncbi:MAG: hypothetical protein ACYCXN_06085 [Acidimicrobiales bacterium]